ncbi:hypothetical protein GZ77_19885 [Endozoicomonas montiporae]|uniref:Uncharacterized protein n=1 Tax=Endozoicomonas montiporae TaxID=1027273 RepID=A0A081N2Q7_9GAMM|nr:hypothetical protein GZ77_19885 [Endozoicomonas montiporae]
MISFLIDFLNRTNEQIQAEQLRPELLPDDVGGEQVRFNVPASRSLSDLPLTYCEKAGFGHF